MTYQLREYQQNAIQALRGSFATGKKRPILQAVTGAGKTMMAVDVIKSALEKGRRVFFVVDRITLIDQTSKVFDKHNLDHGIIQADHWRNCEWKKLQLCSVQTLSRRDVIAKPDLIIVDECHAVYQSFVKLLEEKYAEIPVIGLSATPWTKGLGKIFDDLVVVETTQGLIEQGYLSDYVAYGGQEIDLKGVKTVGGDYNQKQLAERVTKTKIIGDVVDTWLRLGEDRQTICFTASIAHSESLVDEFRANGVPAASIDAYTEAEERDAIIAQHEDGEIKVLCNVGILTKGYDSPHTTCLILARPTKSLMLHIQMIGRVLRKSHEDAIILDHGGNIERLGFPTDQLPEYLCNGEKGTQEAKEREVKEVLPTPCEKCKALSTSFICPVCGHKPEVMPKVEAVKGEMKKLDRVSMDDKRRWHSMLLGYVRGKGWKDGAADHIYREKFGVWPAKKVGVMAIAPDEEVKKYIQHRNIKQAKSRRLA